MKILIAIIMFSVLIIVHELGHFLLAKKNGVYVTEFSVGMGPRILSTQKGETRYSLKLLPFGGSCMMLGEDEETTGNDRAFDKQSVWTRISIVVAGPIFNFIFAFFLSLFVIYNAGYDPATVTAVTEGSPAYEAGIQEGDTITSINGKKVDISRDLTTYLMFDPLTAASVEYTYERDGESYSVTIDPQMKDTYMLGFGYTASTNKAELESVYEDYPFYEAGLETGDIITSVNGTEITTGSELNTYFKENPLTDEVVMVTYERDGVESTVEVTPKLSSSSYTTGMSVNTGYVKANVWETFKYSVIEVKYWIKYTFKCLGQLVTGKIGVSELSGPVGLVDAIGQTYEASTQYGVTATLVNLFTLCILISANLGVMNLIPLPALDGGRLLFMLIEIVRGGRPVPKEKEGMVHMIGMIALMALSVFVLYNDIMRLF